MKEILAFIEKKKYEFSQLPFFEYLRDQSINPRQRLAFAPCAAPFIMSFGELNRSVFRDEPTDDPIQKIINKHTYEDDHHWMWFLEDLEKLGFNKPELFSKTLEFLWGSETQISRRLVHQLHQYTCEAKPIQRLIVIEAAESTGNVFLAASSQTIRDLQNITAPEEYQYFGASHLIVDTGHTYCSPKSKQYIESIKVTEPERKYYFELIEKVFVVFTEFIDELFAYAKTHSIEDITPFLPTNFKPIGAYLLESGLINSHQLQHALIQQKSTPLSLGQIVASQGWVKQQTIEYLVEKVIESERQMGTASSPSFVNHLESQWLNDSSSSRTQAATISKSNPSMKLGDYLLEAALVNTEQLKAAIEEQKLTASSTPLGKILADKGWVKQQTVEYLMEKVVIPERELALRN
ncbi:hypothetical protein [Altericista sp. CCNU0014]|uniref:hypothetical protein n=1 Tax=Altericista sp. CCNU0014 TaxID=3082949 RepID=UPI00384D0DD2